MFWDDTSLPVGLPLASQNWQKAPKNHDKLTAQKLLLTNLPFVFTNTKSSAVLSLITQHIGK
jgi:hypothetical protein